MGESITLPISSLVIHLGDTSWNCRLCSSGGTVSANSGVTAQDRAREHLTAEHGSLDEVASAAAIAAGRTGPLMEIYARQAQRIMYPDDHILAWFSLDVDDNVLTITFIPDIPSGWDKTEKYLLTLIEGDEHG